MTAKKVLLFLGITLGGIALAATSYTTYFNLAKPSDGDTNWGASYRDNMDTIDSQLNVNTTGLAAHLADTTGAHAASAISTTIGTTCSTSLDVQDFLDCLDGQIAGLSGGAGVFLLADNNVATGINTFTGISNFSNTVTISGGLNLSGGSAGILHATATTGVVSSSPVVLTSASEVSGILPLANGGTNASLTAASGAIVYGTGSALAMGPTGATGSILQSGNTGAPTWSTATYPSTAAATGTILRANGTNYVATTATYPTAVGATGTILRSNGTDNAYTTAAYPATVGATGSILVAGGANFTSTNMDLADTDAVGSTILALANGGTSKNMTAVNGGVVWTDADSQEVTAAGTSGQSLQSAGTAAPTWVTSSVVISAHSATATVTGTDSDVAWTTEDQDSANAFNGTTFTVPSGAGGTYSVDAMLRMSATTIAIDQVFQISVYKNGSQVSAQFISAGATTQTKYIPHVFWQGALVATDTIKIQVLSTATSAPVIVASAVSNILAIRKVGN